jgi:hypothetical protein
MLPETDRICWRKRDHWEDLAVDGRIIIKRQVKDEGGHGLDSSGSG